MWAQTAKHRGAKVIIIIIIIMLRREARHHQQPNPHDRFYHCHHYSMRWGDLVSIRPVPSDQCTAVAVIVQRETLDSGARDTYMSRRAQLQPATATLVNDAVLLDAASTKLASVLLLQYGSARVNADLCVQHTRLHRGVPTAGFPHTAAKVHELERRCSFPVRTTITSPSSYLFSPNVFKK